MITKAEIRKLIEDFVDNSPVNRMGEAFGDEKMWGHPLVGFANGADPMFREFKDRRGCGTTHWLPAEIFNMQFPESQAKPEELNIISWSIPQTELTKASMRCEDRWPSERWARARVIGEPINDEIRKYMIKTLTAMGYEVMAPVLHPEWTRLENEVQTFTSKWSERHIAHCAGLGTFSFNDALITRHGIAHRLGSLIIKAPLKADKRPYQGRYDWCLYFAKGTCLACVKRCPGEDALTLEHGHLKKNCKAYSHGKTIPFIKENYHIDGYGCGFCQTNVPCESRIPAGIQVMEVENKD